MELVGHCRCCGKPVYCRDGFLDGVSDNGNLYCLECFAESSQEGNGQKKTYKRKL